MLSFSRDYSPWSGRVNKRRNREWLETVVEALEVATSGARKSHIMLKANLNSLKASELIESLILTGLLVCEGSNYQTTERGFKLIDLFREIEDILGLKRHELEAIGWTMG